MKKISVMGVGTVLSAVVAGGFLFLGVANAQTASSIKVQPALFEQVVNPGDVFSTSITVTNPDPAARQFTVSVEDITDINSSGQPVFSTTSVPEYGLSAWIGIPQPTFTIPAYGSKQVSFTVRVPAGAIPGGHYAAIFVNFGATRLPQTGAGVSYQVGALLDFRIAGQANEQAEVRAFSTEKGLYQGPNVTFTADVADTGNVLLRPRGPIDITNMFGQKVATIVMNDANEAIFPGTNRTFTANWTGSGFTFGRFDAVMSLTYGNDVRKTVSASTSFWVIPLVPIAAVLGSIIFFVLIFIWSLRTYIRRKVSAMTGGSSSRSSLSEEEKFLLDNRMPFSRLALIVIVTAAFAVIFLIILFLLFG